MIPVTEELHEALGGEGERDSFYRFSSELETWMQRVSLDSPVAYAEAEYFGGVGCQNAVAWSNGERVLEPVHADNAINQVLKLLGVSASGIAGDEFEALGLSKHRATESWLPV